MDYKYSTVGVSTTFFILGGVLSVSFNVGEDHAYYGFAKKIEIFSICFLAVGGTIIFLLFIYCLCCGQHQTAVLQNEEETLETDVISYHMDNNNELSDSQWLDNPNQTPKVHYSVFEQSKEVIDQRIKSFNRRIKVCSYFVGGGLGFLVAGMVLTIFSLSESKSFKKHDYIRLLKSTITVGLFGFLLSGVAAASIAVLKKPPYNPTITPYPSTISTISHYSEGYQYHQPDYTKPPPEPPLSPPIIEDKKSMKSYNHQQILPSGQPYFEHI